MISLAKHFNYRLQRDSKELIQNRGTRYGIQINLVLIFKVCMHASINTNANLHIYTMTRHKNNYYKCNPITHSLISLGVFPCLTLLIHFDLYVPISHPNPPPFLCLYLFDSLSLSFSFSLYLLFSFSLSLLLYFSSTLTISLFLSLRQSVKSLFLLYTYTHSLS